MYPADEEQIVAVLDAVVAADAVLIPFGGGTNIAGSLEAPRDETRLVVSVDLGRLDKVLDIDEQSGLARIQAGALGPDLEKQLNERGWTLGHFPDSFTHSTLGGWIATRSSGMQSDKYGDIADITRGAARGDSPAGTLAMRPCRRRRPGRACARWCSAARAGSASSPRPPCRCTACPRSARSSATSSRTGPRGLAAMHGIAASDAAPSVTRVSDANETAFSFATRKARRLARQFMSSALKPFLQQAQGLRPRPDVPVVHRLRGHAPST